MANLRVGTGITFDGATGNFNTLGIGTVRGGFPDGFSVGTAATIHANGNVTCGIITTTDIVNATPLTNRNLIMNGAIQVAQRGTTATCNSGSNTYSMDRWYARGESSLGVFTLSQEDITSNAQGVAYAAKVTVTTNAATPGSGDVYKIAQRIEGQNVAHLELGRATAKSFTLSFSVKSSVTGTHSGSFMNSAQNQSFPFTYTINSADTWEDKVVNVPARTSGSWVVNNGIGLELNFDMGSGSGKRGTAGQWAGARAEGATGAVQLISTSSATWFITKVQIEVGSVATPFEHRSFGDELSLCLRYYELITERLEGSNSNENPIGLFWGDGSNFFTLIPFKVKKRAQPTLDISNFTNAFRAYGTGGGVNVSTMSANSLHRDGMMLESSGNPGSSGHTRIFVTDGGLKAKVAVSAEL